MKYSLANYILSIEPNDNEIKRLFGTIAIGGEGSVLNTITLSHINPMFSTTGYATGGWVHTKSLDRHGTVSLTINQLSDKIGKFIQLVTLFISHDYDGFTLSLSDTNGNKIATCIDCYISKIPEQSFKESAEEQTWEFTCGQINYN